MKVFGAKMPVPARHLKRGVTEDPAETIEVTTILHPPGCERVPKIMEAEIDKTRTPTCCLEALLPGSISSSGCLPRVWYLKGNNDEHCQWEGNKLVEIDPSFHDFSVTTLSPEVLVESLG